MQITEDMAELFGLHAGDGSLYSTNRGKVWELRGNKKEKEFYDEHIIPLLKRIYAYPFIGKERKGGKNGCYGTSCCQKDFHSILINAGFKVGKKSKTVSIPKSVFESNKSMKRGFLRGFFATDGTAYLNKNNYPLIEVASASQLIIEQISTLLYEFNIKNYFWEYSPKRRGGKTYHLRISGKQRCRTFINSIGLINPVHYERIKGKV